MLSSRKESLPDQSPPEKGSSNNSQNLSNKLVDAIYAYTDKRKKPKRNRSAFILFSIDLRKKQQEQKDLNDLNPNDKFVKIAELWKEISEEERRVYEERARQEKERYVSELSAFCQVFPSEPIQRPRNHIKKPCNAYGFFLRDMKEQIRKTDPKMRMCEVLRIVGEKWKHLTQEEKQVYEEKAEIGRKDFKAQVKKQMQGVRVSGNKSTKQKISPKKEEINLENSTSKTTQRSLKKSSFSDNDEDYEPRGKKIRLNPPTSSDSKKEGSTKSTVPLRNQTNQPIQPIVQAKDQPQAQVQTQPVIQPQIPQPQVQAPSQTETHSHTQSPPLQELLSHQTFPQFQLPPLRMQSMIPFAGLNGGLNNPASLYLMDLYWKVETLRQKILVDLNSVVSQSPTQSQGTTGLPSLLGQFNSYNLLTSHLNQRILHEEFKQEEL